MPLRSDPRQINKARISPWESAQGRWGIDYTTDDGVDHSDLIGTRAEAEAVLRMIGLEHGGRPTDVAVDAVALPKDIAAS